MKTTEQLRFALAAAIALLSAGGPAATAETASPSPVPAAAEPAAARPQQVLDEVWEQIAKLHYDRDFKANQAELYRRRQPDILTARSDAEIAEKINRMLREIGDSHIALQPPPSEAGRKALQAAAANSAAASGEEGQTANPPPAPAGEPEPAAAPAPVRRQRSSRLPFDPGFSVLAVPGAVVVNYVEPGSDADRAGVRPGDRIVAVDEVEIKPAEEAEMPWGLLTRSLLGTGTIGVPLELKLLGPDGAARSCSFPRRLAHRRNFFRLGHVAILGSYQSRLLAEEIGYLELKAFIPYIITRFRQDLRGRFAGCRALIIDLRGNPGGLINIGSWLASWSTDRAIPIASLTIGGTEMREKSVPQKGSFTGKLAILIDGESASTSEIVSAALQDAGLARIFGTPTPGKCLPSNVFGLPSGFRLQTVTGDCRRPSGQRLEGIGVTPDVEAVFTGDRDLPLELALEYLRRELN